MQFIARLISTTIIAGLTCLVMVPMTPYVPTEWRYYIWAFAVFSALAIGYWLEIYYPTHPVIKEIKNELESES